LNPGQTAAADLYCSDFKINSDINIIKAQKHPLCTDHHPAEGDAFSMITVALTSYLYKKR
jgi:hypothetical protein